MDASCGIEREWDMCRSIKTLANFAPPATDDEIRASALQFVRKLSGTTRPSRANEQVFNRAVDEIAAAAALAPDATLLICNAGVLDFGSLLDAPVDALHRNMDTNYFGMLHTARAFAPVIEGNGGGAETSAAAFFLPASSTRLRIASSMVLPTVRAR